MTNQDKYRGFCDAHLRMSVFESSVWLDQVIGEDKWDVAIVEKGDQVIAAWPYVLTKVKGFNFLRLPALTRNLGPVITFPEGIKQCNKIAHEHDCLRALYQQLPKYDHLELKLDPNFKNALALHWEGLELKVNYTYLISDCGDKEALFSDFRENVRRSIRKAEKSLSIEESDDVSSLWRVHEFSQQRAQFDVIYDQSYLEKIHSFDQSQILLAKHSNGDVVAGILLVWDQERMYYILGGMDADYKDSGAKTLLLWHAIQKAGEMKLAFDFEGSMLEGVEKFFRSFGAHQQMYISLFHSPSKKLNLLKSIKSMAK